MSSKKSPGEHVVHENGKRGESSPHSEATLSEDYLPNIHMPKLKTIHPSLLSSQTEHQGMLPMQINARIVEPDLDHRGFQRWELDELGRRLHPIQIALYLGGLNGIPGSVREGTLEIESVRPPSLSARIYLNAGNVEIHAWTPYAYSTFKVVESLLRLAAPDVTVLRNQSLWAAPTPMLGTESLEAEV